MEERIQSMWGRAGSLEKGRGVGPGEKIFGDIYLAKYVGIYIWGIMYRSKNWA